MVAVNRSGDNSLKCPFPDCDYVNKNRDNYQKHVKKVHGVDGADNNGHSSSERSFKRASSPTELGDRNSKKARLENGSLIDELG